MSLAAAFAANLRRQRARRRMSQGQVAAAAGVCVSYVSMLERGERSPPLETVEAFARALDVAPLRLLAS